jgi:glycosyltransferase involved in cell wall biosynthesis
MNHPLISIILCTYNGERFLKEQLESLLWQTYPNLEIIVSDDASQDNTVNILNRYMNDKRLRVVFQEKNLGPAKNFEYAVTLAGGEYIAFADQDDIWLPEKLEKLIASIKESYLVFSDSFLIDEYGNKINKQLSQLRCMFSTNDTRGFIFSNIVWGHTMLIHKNLLQHVLPIPSNIPHDIWMAVNATIFSGMQYFDEPLTLYRQHSATVTTTIPVKAKSRHHEIRYKDFKDKLNWIGLILEREREGFQSFYRTFYNLYVQKEKGKFVWPLFFFMLKYRRAFFQFTRKKIFSQLAEIRKQSRGEYI